MLRALRARHALVAVVGLALTAAAPGLWTNVDPDVGVSSFQYSGATRTHMIDLGDEMPSSDTCPDSTRARYCSVANVTTDTSYPPVFVTFDVPFNRPESGPIPIYPPGTNKISGVNTLDWSLGSITGITLVRQSTDAADVVIACACAR